MEFVVVPRIEKSIAHIIDELDEQDREDFYRIKVVQDKKKEAKALEYLELQAAKKKTGANNDQEDGQIEEEVETDILAETDNINLEDDDEDIIF